MQTIVIGHKNPDMDAIVSVIGYAALKHAQGDLEVVAGRCGSTNERIDFVLKKFGFDPPQFFSDVRPRVSDVMERNVITAHARAPVYIAMSQIGELKFRGLPVTDDENRCLGLISGFKISRYLFPPIEEVAATREVEASMAAICETIGAKHLVGDLDHSVRRHILVIGAMHTTSFEERIRRLDIPRTVLVVGDRFNIQHIAVRAGMRAMLVTGGFDVTPDVLDAARKAGTIVLVSPHDTATTILLARSAITSEQMSYSDFESFEPDLPLDQARQRVAMLSQFAFPVLDEGRRLLGIVSKSDFLRRVPRQLILLDHNELSQAVDGAEDIPIAEIIDHHRLGNAPSTSPILFINRPVGSTSTIVATCYDQAGVAIPKDIAGILMAGLIADTLNLSSPTTTDVDHAMMARLSRLAGIDPTRLAEEIFSIGSPLLTMSAAQAIVADCKEYAEGGRRFSVAQIEELTFAHFPEKKDALLEALEKYRLENGYLFSTLLVTDINTQDSLLLVRGSEEFMREIDYTQAEPFIWRLEGVVSRKKQLMPYIVGLIHRMT